MKRESQDNSISGGSRVAFLERELQKSESKWHSIIEYVPLIGISLDPEGNIVFANQYFLDLTGWGFEEISGRSWFDLFLTDDDREGVREVFLATMRRNDVGPHSRHQNKIVTRDGNVRDVSWFNVLTLNEEGHALNVTSLGIDLTAQEEAEAALHTSEERLSLALEAARDAVWEWNPVTHEVFFSPQWFIMLGYEPDEKPPGYETWRELVHKGDIEETESLLREALEKRGSFKYEFRMLTKAGEWRWILARAKVVSSDSDGTVRMVGTHTDIHERKLAELGLKEAKDAAEAAISALRLNMAHLRTLVETIPDLVWLKDVNGVFLSCNQRFERLYGAPEAEIVGKTDYDFVDRELADSFRRHDRAAMAAGKPTVNEETVKYKDDGHIEELETIKTPMLDDRGALIGVLGVARDITRRNRIADQLKESELRFKALHNASFGGIAIHDKGLILDCNQGLADISGFSMEELIGMDGLQLIGESAREKVMGNILAGYEKPYEAVGVRKNGEEYPLRLEGRNIPYKGRMVRTVEFRDISQRKKAEKELRDSELRHRVIFENSPLGMVRFSVDGRILDCNSLFVELMGSTREELIGFHTLKRSNRKMREALGKALHGEPSSYEDYYTSVSGNKETYLHVQFNPVNLGRPPTEVIATLEDFSERKETRDGLQRAKEEAEAFSRSKTEFLTNMSHEIRTPLNGILGMLQLLQNSDLDMEQAGYVVDAIQSSKRLTRLLTDILDLSRVEAGKLMVQDIPFNLKESCRQVCDLYRLTADQSGVALRCEIDPAIPDFLAGDPLRVQQVMTNLIGNAFKFTPEGHIALSASVLPSSTPEVYRILFTVSDTGKGIPDDKLGTLFDTFTQVVGEGYTRQHQGAGLGLAICKQLIQLMGGGISVESEVGRGTAVYVVLPFVISKAPEQPRPAVAANRVCCACGKFRVLLAEDERVNSLVTRRLLEKAGHDVCVVENGEQAIAAVREGCFDVILMDIQMPVMDGVTATKAIRSGAAGEAAKDIPIAAVTAFAMVGDREKFLEAGMDGYVVKPIELEKLQQFLDSIRR
ncbi:PAS domain-containing hybrid sensor histidine kinase/response regulator [Pseudodesulfovibrio portus]|uniref:histidine kinase n=1 Tax=Pseudodesulfovibrio portus TaxID=231439 RepID=A0ABM8AUA3_9BACT|nr:PAS domain-containing hybrid sensor histidine kinase/response regulator [Pseudodesulfovibrio portus]BDQ34829.1 hypothetical protein JCM14722_23710 [Pseudodesulfovibrio portus]